MSTFHLRFGQAKTEPQQVAYDRLYPMLVDLRDEVAAGAGRNAPSQG